MQTASQPAEPRRNTMDEFIRMNTTQNVAAPVATPSAFARFMAGLKVAA